MKETEIVHRCLNGARSVGLLLICSLFAVCSLSAQEAQDSVKTLAEQRPMPMNPRWTFGADFSIRPGGNYDIKKDGEMVECGTTGAFSKAGLRASYAIVSKGATRVQVNARYTHIYQAFDSQTKTVDYGLQEHSHHYMTGGLMGMTRLKLWDKSLMVMALVNADFSNHGYERWSAMGTAMLMLKQSRETQLGVGFICLINTFSRVPIFPFATYRHQFDAYWTLNLNLPRFQMEYRPNKSILWSLGAGIDADSYYLRTAGDNLPGKVRYSRTNINMGPGFEYTLPGHLKLIADAGVQVVMTNRICNSGSSRRLATIHEKAAPYLHIGIQKQF